MVVWWRKMIGLIDEIEGKRGKGSSTET